MEKTKYYLAASGNVIGCGGKMLNFSTDKREVTETEFTKVIEDFLLDPQMEEEEINKTRGLIWSELKRGRDVVIEENTLSIKERRHKIIN